ncbi:MAG TPA: hypothetical protein DDZ99_06740 [Clostridiales bacterium]|nr:hypothetical protein [Clostridiales bacterium]
MELYKNGFIVQQSNFVMPCMKFTKNICYKGISAYSDYPLYDYINDKECEALQNEIWYKKIDNKYSIQLNFITNPNLLYRYIKMCKKYNIQLRYLFIESDIDSEIWNAPIPDMNFIGYEYCEIPFDSQVISDLDTHEPFQKHRDKLNKYGLFSTLDDAKSFKFDYDNEFATGIIGDGEMETHIFRVSKVNSNYH